ncbi:MAG: pitrilysin family protein, partial [Sphingomicrobium sp.]
DKLSAQDIAEAKERLGASLNSGGSADRSSVALSALSPNLVPSLGLMTEMVERPAFAPVEIERIRSQLLTSIAQAKTTPSSMAARALPALLYGASHPYATTAMGNEAAVKGFSREQLIGFKDRWLRPDNAELFVVSDLPLATLKPILETALGSWQAPVGERGIKRFGPLPARPTTARIVLIDRPGSPQSFIYGGQLTPVDPRAENTALFAGSDVLGGSTASRINLELRERRGWSYGAFGFPQLTVAAVPFLVQAPVQADRTGDSIAALMVQLRGILGAKGVTDEERVRAVANSIGGLPGQFETGSAVLSAMQTNALYGRPDNYYELLGDRYRALNNGGLDQALRQAIDVRGFVWVVVGEAAKIRPQLEKLKMPIEVIQPR